MARTTAAVLAVVAVRDHWHETEGQTDFGTGLWPEGATKDFRQATPEDPPDRTPVEDWEPNRK
jgi:hypothetical protein